VARALFPGTEAAMVELLHRAGYQAVPVGDPECCGALAEHIGDRTRSCDLGRELLETIPESAILIPTAAGCGAHLKALPQILESGSANHLADRVRDLSEALLDAPVPLSFADGSPVRVVYQDACHLRHGQGIVDPPRELLSRAGAILIDSGDEDLCCGSAGTYNLARPEMARRVGLSKAERVAAAGVRMVVTSNPGCAIQLEAVLPESVEVVSFARFLRDRLDP
jgi:glycolate oxidase iron-sulfur subunit